MTLRTVLLGDSVTAEQTWFTTANAAAGGPCSPVDNSGTPSNTTTMMLDRLERDVLAARPAVVMVVGGTNDIGTMSAGATIANLAAIYAAVVRCGAVVVAGTILPRVNSTVQLDPLPAPLAAKVVEVNGWLAAQDGAAVRVVDWASVLASGSATSPNLAYFRDGIHPNAAGAALLAGVLAPVLAALPPARPDSVGWRQVHALFLEKAPPVRVVGCPSCGWPLQAGPGQVRFCPQGDWRGR